jgi:hypothetical protein
LAGVPDTVLNGQTSSVTAAFLNAQVVLGAASTLTDCHIRDCGLNVSEYFKASASAAGVLNALTEHEHADVTLSPTSHVHWDAALDTGARTLKVFATNRAG